MSVYHTEECHSESMEIRSHLRELVLFFFSYELPGIQLSHQTRSHGPLLLNHLSGIFHSSLWLNKTPFFSLIHSTAGQVLASLLLLHSTCQVLLFHVEQSGPSALSARASGSQRPLPLCLMTTIWLSVLNYSYL